MLRNIKLIVQYEGTNYQGWQIQNSSQSRKKTLQETIQNSLKQILQERIKLIGSGRTDSGVHARAQVANFKTNSRLSLVNLQRALNSSLARDIVITGIEEVPFDFHSRFDAKAKIYRYTILNQKTRPVFERHSVYFYPHKLDINLMRAGARYLKGRHNFSSFAASNGRAPNMQRTIKNIKVYKEKNFIYIDIEADGFLYKMVRNIAGSLIELGRKRFSLKFFKEILGAQDRRLAGPTAPGCGLCLIRVKYK
ncbi:MAG: tRNA pseudouridine(38-40) synthase TruA [Candidatus Omnitrophica bacterium]|nr:tRNA pseudouridine(38-40) synthase TruA [Candidatus Omnitrophota bacterium]